MGISVCEEMLEFSQTLAEEFWVFVEIVHTLIWPEQKNVIIVYSKSDLWLTNHVRR